MVEFGTSNLKWLRNVYYLLYEYYKRETGGIVESSMFILYSLTVYSLNIGFGQEYNQYFITFLTFY